MKTLRLHPPSTPLRSSIAVPGSKSYTNRALLLAAMARGRSRISYASESTDSDALVHGLSKLGVIIQRMPSSDLQPPSLEVQGCGPDLVPYHGTIDVGPAGTSMRFLTALCATIPGADIELRGTDRMHQRPIGELVSALRDLGASIDYLGKEGCPPLRIHSPSRLRGGTVEMNGTISSQFISALLMIAPLLDGPLMIEVDGAQISRSYIDMTLQSISDFGVTITNNAYRSYRNGAEQIYSPRDYAVEGDASGASYLWGIAAVSGGEIRVENINPDSAQGDIHFPELIAQMGCKVTRGDRSITVQGPTKLRAIDADMTLMPDTAQTLAVIAACAEGTTTIRGLSTLRVKETDRIDALQTELAKIGISSETGPDFIVVHGGKPRSARIATYDDHRMAMSFAMLGARGNGIEIEEPHVVEKSFPAFWEALGGIWAFDHPKGKP